MYSGNRSKEILNGTADCKLTKNRKSKIRSVLVFALSVIFLSTSMSFLVFGATAKAAVFGSKYYYLMIEKQNYDKAVKQMKDNYLAKSLLDYSYSGTVNAKLGGDVIESDKDLKKAADFLSKFECDFNYNGSSKNLDDMFYTASVSANYDSRKLGGLDIKFADNKAVIAFPELTDKTLGIKTSDMAAKITKAILCDDDAAFSEIFGLNRDEFKKMTERYIKDVIIKAIPNEKVDFKVNAEYRGTKCNVITFNIDKTVAANIYKALAKEIRSDTELRTLCKSTVYSMYDMMTGTGAAPGLYQDKPSAYEISKAIQDFSDELSAEAENLEDIDIAYTAYFQDNGNVLLRQFSDKNNNGSIELENYTNALNSDVTNFKIKTDGKDFITFTNKDKLQDGSYIGNVYFDINGTPLLDADYTSEKDAKVGNLPAFVGEVKGKLYLKQLFQDMFGVLSSDESSVDDIDFGFTSKRQGSDTLLGEASVSTKIENKSFTAAVSTKIKQSNALNISKPQVSLSNSIDMYDTKGMMGLETDISKNLIDKLVVIFPEMKQYQSLLNGNVDEYNGINQDDLNYDQFDLNQLDGTEKGF